MARYIKDPSAVLDYGFDWTDWLDGDTIATSTWTAPTGLTVASHSNTTTTTLAWLSGGTAGQVYSVVNRVVTAGGRTDDRSHIIAVQDR